MDKFPVHSATINHAARMRFAIEDIHASTLKCSKPFATCLNGDEKNDSSWLIARMSNKECVLKNAGKIKVAAAEKKPRYRRG